MPLAAVPRYLGQDFNQASSGLRFGLYLPIWTDRWNKDDAAARDAWRQVTRLDKDGREAMKAINLRFDALASTLPESSRLRLEAVATAPFTTGLGNEHPLENGFAFLFPYGIPYLAGSGVKGVLRRAAQELARGDWGEDTPWFGLDQPSFTLKSRNLSLSVIDVLFGREPAAGDGEHVRGAIDVWDVVPCIEGDSLLVEIMTPHQSHYYQDGEPPHECADPIPIPFLTLAPGARFVFRLRCHTEHLTRLTREPRPDASSLLAVDGEGKARWQELLEVAFAHAFDWLGFGAKTSVGYGAMQRDPAAEAKHYAQEQAAREAARKQAEIESLSPQRRRIQAFIDYAEKELERPHRPKSKIGQRDYQEAQKLAKDAQAADWSAEDRAAARQAIETYLPRLADISLKDIRKKLELDKLAPPTQQ